MTRKKKKLFNDNSLKNEKKKVSATFLKENLKLLMNQNLLTTLFSPENHEKLRFNLWKISTFCLPFFSLSYSLRFVKTQTSFTFSVKENRFN